MNRFTTTLALCLLSTALIAGPAAAADRHDRRVVPHQRWEPHGNIHNFPRHDLNRWRDGRWVHGHHDGRLGWWWVVGSLWYFYNAPVYPYPNPYLPPSVMRGPVPPPPGRYLFYCEPFHDYYPYVTTCPPGGWRLVPVR